VPVRLRAALSAAAAAAPAISTARKPAITSVIVTSDDACTPNLSAVTSCIARAFAGRHAGRADWHCRMVRGIMRA